MFAKLSKEFSVESLIVGLSVGATALMVAPGLGYYFVSAKFLAIAVFLCILSIFIFAKGLKFFLPSAVLLNISLSLTIFATIVAAVSTHMGERVTGVTLILIWALIALGVSSLALNKGRGTFLKNFIYIQFPVIAFIFAFFLLNELTTKAPAKPFFGNPNIASNYIAISIIQLLFFFHLVKGKGLKIAAIVFAIIGFVIMFLYHSRGALAGVGLGTLYFAIFMLRKSAAQYKRYVLGAAAVIIAVLGVTQYQKGVESFLTRKAHWINTLCMVRDYPLGVGPGSFEYVFQSYNGKCVPSLEIGESVYIRNPHNAFLEFFAEIGIAGATSLLLSIVFLFLALRATSKKKYPLEYAWVVATSIVFGVIGFFEFPQDTPFTFLYLAIVFGIAMSILPGNYLFAKSKKSSYLRIIHLTLALLASFTILVKTYSSRLTLLPGSDKLSSYKVACGIDNENWKACTFLGLTYIDQKEFELAQKVIDKMNYKFDGWHSLMFLRGTYAQKTGDMGIACEQFKQYHALFGYNSSQKKFIEEKCSN